MFNVTPFLNFHFFSGFIKKSLSADRCIEDKSGRKGNVLFLNASNNFEQIPNCKIINNRLYTCKIAKKQLSVK